LIDYKIPQELPCCGVAVLCHILDKPFQDVYENVKKSFDKDENWYGGMTIPEFLLMLIYEDIDFEEKQSDLTLEQYAKLSTDECIINTPNHFQLYKNGIMHDQYGSYPAEQSKWKDKKITKIIKIL